MKKRRLDDAVSEMIGTILLLGISVTLFAVVYLVIVSYPFNESSPYVNIVGAVEGNNVILEHRGGESLGMKTKFLLSLGGIQESIAINEYLGDSNENGQWDIGERLVYPAGDITDLQVETTVIDVNSNSIIMTGVLHEGETVLIPSLVTSVDTISPYIQMSSPFNVIATGESRLDNVTLYYRWSEDNWTIDWTILTCDGMEDGTSGNYTGAGSQSQDYNVVSGSQIDGTYSLHLQDNTDANWALTNNIAAEINGYTQIMIEFKWKVNNFNNPGTEDWWFQYYNSSSSNWETVEDFDCGPGTKIDQQSGNNWDGEGSETYFFNESQGWSLSDEFNIRFYCDASGDGDELYIDSIYINATTGKGDRTNWLVWDDASNPDRSYSWNWNFDFPNSTGYYEFYSIGMYNGNAEDVPGSPDAICKYEE